MIDSSIDTPWLKVCRERLRGALGDSRVARERLGEGPVIAGLPGEVKKDKRFISLNRRVKVYNDGGEFDAHVTVSVCSYIHILQKYY